MDHPEDRIVLGAKGRAKLTKSFADLRAENDRLRFLLASKAQFGEDPLTCPCAKENKVHPDCQEAEHCVRKQA